MVRIRSKREGFIRCGVRHSEQWTEHPDEKFNAKQLKTLQAEPMLQVEIVRGKPGEK